MESISLSDYILAVVSKKLSKVEIDGKASNQHELNGVKELKKILGTGPDKLKIDCVFMYLTDEEEDCFTRKGQITWYDSRSNNPNRSAEYRLYYSKEFDDIMSASHESDDIHLIKKNNGEYLMIVCDAGSTTANQLRWLFGLHQTGNTFTLKEISDKGILSYPAHRILEELGIEAEPPKGKDIEELIEHYSDGMPSTKEFSNYTREHIPISVDPIEDPDQAIEIWVEKEEYYYRALEKHLIQKDLEALSKEIANQNPECANLYIQGAMHYIQVRKSRAGRSFEEHIEALLKENEIKYSAQKRTENGKKPDFIMPSIEKYWDPSFNINGLTMLAAKTTCKERWAQILEEAKRLNDRHLITLEPAISEESLNAMKVSNIQVIIPQDIRLTYSEDLQKNIWNVKEFISFVKRKQQMYC